VLPAELQHRFAQGSSVLDVGCGIRPQVVVPTNRYVGVDAHWPYIEAVDHSGEFIYSDWRAALRKFRRDEFDLVTALDFIEHLDRRDGLDFLRAAQRVGKAVLIFTPLGPFPQHYGPGESDAWGMDGGHWQTHRSAWTPDDFPNWDIYELPSFHHHDSHKRPLEKPIGAFWAVTP